MILFDRLIGYISTIIPSTLQSVPCRAKFGTSYQWLWGRWQGLCWCDTSFWLVAFVIPNRFIQHIVYLIDPLVSGRSTSYWFFLPQNYKITAPFITATYSRFPNFNFSHELHFLDGRTHYLLIYNITSLPELCSPTYLRHDMKTMRRCQTTCDIRVDLWGVFVVPVFYWWVQIRTKYAYIELVGAVFATLPIPRHVYIFWLVPFISIFLVPLGFELPSHAFCSIGWCALPSLSCLMELFECFYLSILWLSYGGTTRYKLDYSVTL